MRLFDRFQSVIVKGESAQEFEDKLNRALNQIAAKRATPTITFPPSLDYCAYITYKVETRAPETISETYEAAGLRCTCCECPEYRPSMDGRVRYTTCDQGVKNVRRDSAACDWFYLTYPPKAEEKIRSREEQHEEPKSASVRRIRG